MNLVPNPGFENVVNCPQFGTNEICLASPWFDATHICNASSDIFHPCTDPFGGGGVPYNFIGFQEAFDGSNYSGISPYNDYLDPDNWREYIEVKLNDTLIAFRNYCVNWYSSLADYSRYGCNKIGAHFSSDSLIQLGNQMLYIDIIPQIENQVVFIDTSNWELFYQSFTALGGENYMTIGNFRPGIDTDTTGFFNQNGFSAYYYFDELGVYLLPEIDAGVGGEICNFGESVQLEASCLDCWEGLEYRWWPQEGLSHPDSLMTLASPNETTTYYFGLIDPTETVPCIIDLVDSVTVTVCEGVIPSVFDFAIVPNPSTDEVKLVFSQTTDASTLYIYDARGRLIRKEEVPADLNSYVLNIQDLSTGQYSIEIISLISEARRKLIKM